MNTIDLLNSEEIQIKFDYNEKLIQEVKKMSKRRFDWNKRVWICPFILYKEIFRFGIKHKFNFSCELISRVMDLEEKKKNRINPKDDQEIRMKHPSLHYYQYEGIQFLVINKKCLLADEMGLGKTVQSLLAVREFPVLIVTPATLKYNWRREIKKWLNKDAVILDKGHEHLIDSEICIINYDLLQKWELLLLNANFATIIFDESHYIKNGKAIRSRKARDLAMKANNVYLLTGTPIMNKPHDLTFQLKIIDKLNYLGGWNRFIDKYCIKNNSEKPGSEQLKVYEELHDKLMKDIMLRRTKAQVLKSLPEKRIINIFLDLDNREEYTTAENDFVEWLFAPREVVTESRVRESARGTPENTKEALAFPAKKFENNSAFIERALQLKKLRCLRKLTILGKLNQAKKWIEDFLESGEKLVVFAAHIDIQKSIINHFPGCASVIGEMNQKQRMDNVDRFQNDSDCKLIVISLFIGSTGINLTSASNIAFLELDWSPSLHSQAEDRCHRIGQMNRVSVYYLLGKDSIDTRMYASLSKKKDIIDRIIDGKNEKDDMLQEVIESYKSADENPDIINLIKGM
jgi:SWI/SNF-related matrix-associated actin-dependent regulator of chromatin subfamily A-like protein 1